MNGIIKIGIWGLTLSTALLAVSLESYGAVVQASDTPKQTEVIKILDSNASTPTKWAKIQRLSTDAAKYMERHISPDLRSAIEDYRFAIKTNLLQGAVAFAPNLGVEYALNNKSTIELTGALNHWGLDGSATNNKKLVHWILQTEYRYWLGKSFYGHFFGVHALGGKYNISAHTLPNLFWGGDLMESQYRYDGWMMGAGVSYGYHLRFARHWGVEFNIGIGVAHLRYDKYDCIRCGRKLNTENRTYFGPTKAGISLIYNF